LTKPCLPEVLANTLHAALDLHRLITERKEVERLKDELIATVSHELRTPLTSVRGFAELMLERDYSPTQQRRFLGLIRDEAVRLTQLINDFLDLQRLESGRQTYHFAPVAPGPLLDAAVAVFLREGGPHTLRIEAADTLPLVRADAERLHQVLVNLLSNALKFSPNGGVVTVGAYQDGDTVVVWVADQGIGLPQEAIHKLFTRFYRVDNAETRHIGGTGLGLALVKEIVAAHQGCVWVESSLGKGSTFFVALPSADPIHVSPSPTDKKETL
jgi:signal transduction histidine kinase